MISVEEAIRNGIIDKNNMLSTMKCKCGKPLCFSESFKKIYCTDTNCKYKIISRLKSLCERLSIDIDTESLMQLVDKLNIITPYQILLLDEVNINTISNIQNVNYLISRIKDIKSNNYYIYSIAELCGIEEIIQVAKQIFNGFNSFSEAYKYIEAGQVAFINERLGINNQDSTAISLDIFTKLLEIKEELMFAEIKLNTISYTNKLNIVIDCAIEGFVNKAEFIEYLNGRYKYYFILTNIINEDTDILIRNSDTTQKCKLARYINDKNIANAMNNNTLSYSDINKFDDKSLKPIGHKIFITSAQDLLGRLDIINE